MHTRAQEHPGGPPIPACPHRSSWCHSQGFAPSATISIRREDRLMSLWSLCATSAQCMSLDLTQATFAKGAAGGGVNMCNVRRVT